MFWANLTKPVTVYENVFDWEVLCMLNILKSQDNLLLGRLTILKSKWLPEWDFVSEKEENKFHLILLIWFGLVWFYGISIFTIFTNFSARAGYDTKSVFKQSLTGLNSEFSFSYTSCLTKAEEFCLPYYLPIAGGKIIGFIPFLWVLSMWNAISLVKDLNYDYKHYTTGTSIYGISTIVGYLMPNLFWYI